MRGSLRRKASFAKVSPIDQGFADLDEAIRDVEMGDLSSPRPAVSQEAIYDEGIDRSTTTVLKLPLEKVSQIEPQVDGTPGTGSTKCNPSARRRRRRCERSEQGGRRSTLKDKLQIHSPAGQSIAARLQHNRSAACKVDDGCTNGSSWLFELTSCGPVVAAGRLDTVPAGLVSRLSRNPAEIELRDPIRRQRPPDLEKQKRAARRREARRAARQARSAMT